MKGLHVSHHGISTSTSLVCTDISAGQGLRLLFMASAAVIDVQETDLETFGDQAECEFFSWVPALSPVLSFSSLISNR